MADDRLLRHSSSFANGLVNIDSERREFAPLNFWNREVCAILTSLIKAGRIKVEVKSVA
jgi:hypothetical protein